MLTDSFSSDGPFDSERLQRLFRPTLFSDGSGAARSSRRYDIVLIKALMGDSSPLEQLLRCNEQKRMGPVLLENGVITWLDAWAFSRANHVALSDLGILGRMADVGMLRHAREPETGRTLAHALVDWDRGPEMWQILARGGVDFDLSDKRGTKVLIQAAENANHSLIVTLLNLGAAPAALDWDEPTAKEYIHRICG